MRDAYALLMFMQFPSPYGDKLKSPELDNACAYVLFPSPYGDKLK